MEERFKVLAKNGNLILVNFVPMDPEEMCIEGLSRAEIKKFFPDYNLEGLDEYINTYLLVEDGKMKVKGPDGEFLTEEIEES